MKTDNQPRIWATVGTALIAALILLLLNVTHLQAVADLIIGDRNEIVLMDDEEFVDIIEMPTTTTAPDNRDATPYNEQDVVRPSQPTPPSGTDVQDNGPQGDPPQVLASKEPSPVKQREDKPKNPGPSAEELKRREQEEISRKADNEVSNAFSKLNGKNNTANSSTDKGLSGSSSAEQGQQGVSGTGKGTVGGGWMMPQYARVPSTVTGSITLQVKIDAKGNVVSVTATGGTPPAATNSALKQAVIAEVRSHRFTRSDYTNAEPATAYVTYTFK